MYTNTTVVSAGGAAGALAVTGPSSTAFLIMAGFTLVGAGLALLRTLPKFKTSK